MSQILTLLILDSKIVPGRTQNILIDVTATDKTKLDIVVNMLSTMFSEYCKVPFEIEPVKIIMPDGSSHISPPIAPRRTTASSSYINAATGLDLTRERMSEMLNKMSLASQPSATDSEILDVEVPCTRPDILHECDIMEDLAIAWGYNDLPKSLPTTNTVAKPFPINRLADILRKECAQAGWLEALPLILVSSFNDETDNSARTMRTSHGLIVKIPGTLLLPLQIPNHLNTKSSEHPSSPVSSKQLVKTNPSLSL